MTSTYDTLQLRLQVAFDAIERGADPVLRTSDRSDYQANGVMALAKRAGRSPREVAEEIVDRADLAGIAEIEIAGPGFLNLTLAATLLQSQLSALLCDDRLGCQQTASPKNVVIDYSAPNVAKEMHVGNLRSTVIGDALARMYRFAGHHVIARNLVGDWGTPFAMLIEHLIDESADRSAGDLSIKDLDGFYREARVKFDTEELFKDRSRSRVVALQSGDRETLRLWRIIVDQSVSYLNLVYVDLGIMLGVDDVVGESYYNEMLANVVADLDRAGLLVESGGALCVFPPGFTNRDGEPLPLIVQKSDEGFGYAASDLAAVRDRVDHLHADEILYVVGVPQAQHLEMVYAVARMAGWLPERVRCEHVTFGNVLGTDRKMFKSRSGETVKLASLLTEAIQRADKALRERNTDLDEMARTELAVQIARAAIKYADLSTDRQHDYVFDLERMVAFEGDTGPYLQYAYARLRSIIRRNGAPWSPVAITFTLETVQERELALGLLAFPEAFDSSLTSLQPHRLCVYLFDLAQRLTAFYDACPVLTSEGEVREQRLALCDLSARTLATGLHVLGIDAPEQM
ncbi:MAG: arginine--tRNA ligase [Acidimicrobiales bacterium]